jgi:CRISPR-associated protein Csb2
MSDYLCITVRWLDQRYHGRDADGDAEWPPSPLRLFQALLASACRQHEQRDSLLESFCWLQKLSAPLIIAPRSQPGHPYARFVPNNDSDKVFDRQKRLAEKRVAPTLLLESLPIHYVWELSKPVTDQERRWASELCRIARGLAIFGWGVDMAVASGVVASEQEISTLPGERWLPGLEGIGRQRPVPCSGTISALKDRYQLFVNRLLNGYFSDVPPLPESAFQNVGYRRPTEPLQHHYAAFSILKLDASDFRAFNTARKALTVAGMVRCVAKLAASRSNGTWTEGRINAFILGHGGGCGNPKQSAAHLPVGPKRFAYLPLPSIQWRGQGKSPVIGSVRRVVVCCFAEGCDAEITWARRIMSGQQLVDEDKQEAVALLSLIPTSDNVVRCYTQTASDWATVTPVVLPGYDDPEHLRRRAQNGKLSTDQQRKALDRLSKRIDGLLRKAVTQAGFSQELADHAEIDWQKVGFWPGTELADRYGVPDHLKRFPRFHVRIQWRDADGKPVEVPGPVCFGGGRFYGIGLFAARPAD